MSMTCSQCWTTVPKGVSICPRCGAKVTGEAPSFAGLLKSYPWVIVVLALSVMVTLWAATRRPPPPPEPIPPAVEPVTAAPAAEPEPDSTPLPLPLPVAEAPAPAAAPAPAPPPPSNMAPPGPTSGRMLEDGTFEPNSGSALPPGR